MTSQHFKDSARSLARTLDSVGMTYDVYTLLSLTEALISQQDNFRDPLLPPDYSTHEARVMAALGSPEVIAFLNAGKKINAIKELRSITLCGLKEAKDAVEDSRVEVHYIRPLGW